MAERVVWYRTDAHRHKGRKWHLLPCDSARVAWDVLMGEAKLHTEDGVFHSEFHLRDCLGTYAKYIPALRAACILVGPDGEPDKKGLKIKDWPEWQDSSPTKWAKLKKAQRGKDGGQSVGQSVGHVQGQIEDKALDMSTQMSSPHARSALATDSDVNPLRPPRGEAQKLWAVYVETWNVGANAKYETWAKLLQTRAKQHGAEYVEKAIRGSKLDPWDGRVKVHDLEHLLRPANMQKFVGYLAGGNGHKALDVAEINATRRAAVAAESEFTP